MVVNKEQLQFLSDYVSISESTTAVGNKLQIISKIGNKAIFVQKSLDATLIREIDCVTTSDFEILVEVKMFWNFINSVSKNEEIEITPDGFNIGQDKHYTFEMHNSEFFNVDEIMKIINDAKVEDTTFMFPFKDFNTLGIAYKYMGKDTLQTIGFMKDKILGTDRFQIVYGNASFNLTDNYFLSKPAVSLLIQHKDKQEIPIFLNGRFYFFEIEGTICIFEWKSYAIPDLFEAKPYSRFNQKDFVKLNKEEFKSTLNRMSFFVTNNPSMRIFLTLKSNHILIENRDFNKSFEKVYYTQGNQNLEEITVIVNCKNLITFLENMEKDSDEVFFFVNSDHSNRSTIRLEDSTSNFKFIHVLLKSEKIE
jgi:hypothetical protein